MKEESHIFDSADHAAPTPTTVKMTIARKKWPLNVLERMNQRIKCRNAHSCIPCLPFTIELLFAKGNWRLSLFQTSFLKAEISIFLYYNILLIVLHNEGEPVDSWRWGGRFESIFLLSSCERFIHLRNILFKVCSLLETGNNVNLPTHR